jgi:fatty acid desaturase
MDPELSDSLLDPDIKGMSGYLLYLSSIPFWFSRPLTVLRHAFSGPASMDPKSEHYIATYEQQNGIATEARIFVLVYLILLYCSLSLGSNALLFYWVIPTIIGQPFLRFYLIAEHTGCQLGPNMIANTRTTKTYGFYRKLAWNMPYHAEHHAWPSVPFHSLPLVHSLIKGVSLTESGCAPTGKDGYFGVHAGVRKTFK